MEFNIELYEFLKENEICMWRERHKNDTYSIRFGVHVYFWDIKEFIKIVGNCCLDDGGIECNLNNDSTLFIPLEEIFMNSGLRIIDYGNCFDDCDLRDYKDEILKFDK